MLLARTRLLVATLWAGSLWGVGYIAAPTLFAVVPDRVLAGTIAGSLFNTQAWVSIACGVLMLLLLWRPGPAPKASSPVRPSIWQPKAAAR